MFTRHLPAKTFLMQLVQHINRHVRNEKKILNKWGKKHKHKQMFIYRVLEVAEWSKHENDVLCTFCSYHNVILLNTIVNLSIRFCQSCFHPTCWVPKSFSVYAREQQHYHDSAQHLLKHIWLFCFFYWSLIFVQTCEFFNNGTAQY